MTGGEAVAVSDGLTVDELVEQAASANTAIAMVLDLTNIIFANYSLAPPETNCA